MTTSSKSRQAFVDNLSSVIIKGKADIHGILNKLQWSQEQVLEGPNMVRCPMDLHHEVPERSLAKHTDACRLVQEGYSREEQKGITQNEWFYADTKSVVTISIDQSIQNQVFSQVSGSCGIKPVPKTVDRIEKDLTTDEKLAIYEYVVQKATEQGHSSVPLEDLVLDPTSAGQKAKKDAESLAAMIAKQRDLKRRRQTYRAKNVHITMRSQTQIVKEIIDMQMTEITDICKEEQVKKRSEERRRERREESQDRKDERRERKRDGRRRYSDESGDEESSLHHRVRLKVKREEEEGELTETLDSRERSRNSSRSKSPTDDNGHLRRNYDHSPSDRRSSSRHYDKDYASGSREQSIEGASHSRYSSREGSADLLRGKDEESEKRHRKKSKSDRSRHKHSKHKRSKDKVRIKEEKE